MHRAVRTFAVPWGDRVPALVRMASSINSLAEGERTHLLQKMLSKPGLLSGLFSHGGAGALGPLELQNLRCVRLLGWPAVPVPDQRQPVRPAWPMQGGDGAAAGCLGPGRHRGRRGVQGRGRRS